jgi:3'(2'), 5'-bisphosphate nucleotidase
MPLTPTLSTALLAVAEACRVARAVQRELAAVKTLTKEDLSPVTVADFAAQAVVCLRLHAGLGSFDLVGEESAGELRETSGDAMNNAVTRAVRDIWPEISESRVHDAIDFGNHDASAESYWTLDPVDGTKGFLRGGQYAISLALIERGQVVAGVLGCPNLGPDFARSFNDPDPVGTLFYATRDGGAWSLAATDTADRAQRIRVATERPLADLRMCESVESGHSRLDAAHQIRTRLQITGEPARLDSQCKYAVVARGQADAYLRLPTRHDYVEKIWDHAAGALIATEAGAKVTDIHGKTLDFSTGTGLSANKGVVCASASHHAALLDAIAALEG